MTSIALSDKQETSLRLTLDVGSLMDLRINGFGDVFKAVLIGQAYEEYLLIKTALPKDFKNDLQPGATVHMGYHNQGPRYTFESQVLEVIDRPYPLTFITYPTRILMMKKREMPRACCHIPTFVQLDKNTVRGTVTDISSRGCRFVIRLPENLMPRQVTLLDDITLSFPLVGRQGLETFHGSVRNTIIDREKISMGIEFMDLNPQLLSCIDDHVADVPSLSPAGH